MCGLHYPVKSISGGDSGRKCLWLTTSSHFTSSVHKVIERRLLMRGSSTDVLRTSLNSGNRRCRAWPGQPPGPPAAKSREVTIMHSSRDCQVAVIGAGPYGLAAAAHLQFANVNVTLFGRAMDFWQNHMPAGMLLRSPWEASHISDPLRCFTLDSYYAQRHIERAPHISLESFIQYGRWFQQLVAPDLDERYVVTIDKQPTRFRLLLDDGETCYAERVIIATGIGAFAHRPATFDRLPSDLVSHACVHCDFVRFS